MRSFENSNGSLYDRQMVKTGIYYGIYEDGHYRPVLICDPALTERYVDQEIWQSSSSHGPRSSFKASPYSLDVKSYPCLYLDNFAFAWIKHTYLQQFTPSMADSEVGSTGNDFSLAWGEVGERHGQFSIEQEMQYWNDKVLAKDVENESENGFTIRSRPLDSLKALQPPRKRKAKSVHWNSDADMDDEESDVYNAPVGFKREDFDFRCVADNSALSLPQTREADLSPLEWVKHYSSRAMSQPPSVSSSSANGSMGSEPGRVKDRPDKVIVFVHGMWGAKLTRSKLAIYTRLSSLIRNDKSIGSFVMAPFLMNWTKDEFEPVGMFIEYGDYHTVGLNRGSNFEAWERDCNEEDRGHEIIRSAKIYNLAGQLGLTSLQTLCFRRFKNMIGSGRPFRLGAVLRAIGEIFLESSAECRSFLIEFVRENFRELMDTDGESLCQVMKDHKEFRQVISVAHLRSKTGLGKEKSTDQSVRLSKPFTEKYAIKKEGEDKENLMTEVGVKTEVDDDEVGQTDSMIMKEVLERSIRER